jgi:hypothetical protein
MYPKAVEGHLYFCIHPRLLPPLIDTTVPEDAGIEPELMTTVHTVLGYISFNIFYVSQGFFALESTLHKEKRIRIVLNYVLSWLFKIPRIPR